ncbi:MAG: hypothetical protein IKF39_04215 [Oscillospiraceae bacterium]|nr:hypothetical protein [Oscillospiraceae bacterium]
MKNSVFTLEWARAAALRAVRTMAQTALGMITVGMAISEINWVQVGSVALVSGIYSLLTSIAGLPEVPEVPAVTPKEAPGVTPKETPQDVPQKDPGKTPEKEQEKKE